MCFSLSVVEFAFSLLPSNQIVKVQQAVCEESMHPALPNPHWFLHRSWLKDPTLPWAPLFRERGNSAPKSRGAAGTEELLSKILVLNGWRKEGKLKKGRGGGVPHCLNLTSPLKVCLTFLFTSLVLSSIHPPSFPLYGVTNS